MTMKFDTPHEQELTDIRELLIHWQAKLDLLDDQMSRLTELGIFHHKGTPVIPGWWQREDNGKPTAKYLVWPSAYASATGRKRRQYVRKDEIEQMETIIERTRQYNQIQNDYKALSTNLRRIGSDLKNILYRYGAHQHTM